MIVQKEVEQFDDIYWNFTDETNKYDGRFGKIRDEEKTLAVKRLMPESLLNYRFRGTTLPYEELLIALENMITDKVTIHSVSKLKKIDTNAPMEIGVAAGTDRSKKGTEKHLNLQCRQCFKGTGAKGGWNGGEVSSWSEQKYFNSGKGERGASRVGK